jgi:hypothetical protein
MYKFAAMTAMVAACSGVRSEHEQTSVADVISADLMLPARVTENRATLGIIANSAIATDQLNISNAAAKMISTESGLELFSFLVSCALPLNTTLTVPDKPNFEFSGETGLAVEWLDHPLGSASQHWVTACVLSRINGLEVANPISLRGANPALATIPEERDGFPLQEGAFYGDIFTPPDRPLLWVACGGLDQDRAPNRDRICAQPDPAHPDLTRCGFSFAGQCTKVCERKQDFYQNCRAGDQNVAEAITTYLLP